MKFASMKWLVLVSAVALSACGLVEKAISDPKSAEDADSNGQQDAQDGSDEGSDGDGASDEAASGGDGEAASGPCKGPEDCNGGYCAKGPIGDALCTNSPDIVNTVILCKEDTDCKDLCVAFKGSEQCGKAEGTCNCDGPPK